MATWSWSTTPFSDRTGSKVRPALVVQSDALNCRIDDTILAAVSRSTHRASPTQLFIDIVTVDGARTGLRQNSMIQCENLLTFDKAHIIARIGQLSPALLLQVDACSKSMPASRQRWHWLNRRFAASANQFFTLHGAAAVIVAVR